MRRSWALTLSGLSVLAFLYLPVVVLAVFSFNGGRYTSSWDSFSTVWYRRLFDPVGTGDRSTAGLSASLALSLRVALVASLAAVALSALTAIGLRGARRWVSWPLLALWSLPIVLPDIVLGLSWYGAFDHLGLARGFSTIVLAHATMATAFALVVVRARLASLDPTLVEAARDLGASPARALAHVVLPHLRPALLAAFLLAFTLSFDDFMVTLFLAPPTQQTLPVAVYGIVKRGASPAINALATLSLLGTLFAAFLALRLMRPGQPGSSRAAA